MAVRSLLQDQRGQAIWVGFVLLLAIGVIAFAGYQAYQVPQQNAAVEAQHSQDVSSQLQELRNALYNARTGPAGVQSTRLQLGAQYPQRILALNPPPPTGELRTVEPEEPVQFENAVVSGGPYTQPLPEIQTEILETAHETQLLEYEPTYREFQDAPTTRYEHSLLYNAFPAGPIELTEQGLVDGNRINLILVTGEYSEAGSGQVTVDPEVTSGPTDVTIEPEDDEPIVLRIPTADPGVWSERIAEEEDVTVADSGPDWVELELQKGEYTLRMATVSLAGEESTDTFDIRPQQPTADEFEAAVYDVQWQLEEMLEPGVVEQEGDGLVVNSNVDAFTGVVTVSERDGAPVDRATVDFGTNDNDTVGLTPVSNLTTETGRTQTTLVPSDTVGDQTRLFAASGDDVAPLDVEIVEPIFNVTAVDPQEPAAVGESLDVEITVENTGRISGSTEVDLEVDADQDGTFTAVATETTDLLGPGDNETVTLTYQTQPGDSPAIDVRGSTEDDTSEPVTVTLAGVADVLVFDGNEQTDGENVQFDIENTAAEELTLIGGGVDTELADQYNRGTGSRNAEMTIDGEGAIVRNSVLDADGTVYTFTDGPPGGSNIDIDAGETVTVDVGDFLDDEEAVDFQSVEHTTDPEEANMEVLIDIEDEGEVSFFFIVET